MRVRKCWPMYNLGGYWGHFAGLDGGRGEASGFVMALNSCPKEEDKKRGRWGLWMVLGRAVAASGSLKVLHNRERETEGEDNRVWEGCLLNVAP